MSLTYLQADYNQNYINYFTGQHKSAEYKKINPCATVPSATDGDLTITESNAILQYAADVSGAESMYPKDLKKRALVNKWLLWEAYQWFLSCYSDVARFVGHTAFKDPTSPPDAPLRESVEIRTVCFY